MGGEKWSCNKHRAQKTTASYYMHKRKGGQVSVRGVSEILAVRWMGSESPFLNSKLIVCSGLFCIAVHLWFLSSSLCFSLQKAEKKKQLTQKRETPDTCFLSHLLPEDHLVLDITCGLPSPLSTLTPSSFLLCLPFLRNRQCLHDLLLGQS